MKFNWSLFLAITNGSLIGALYSSDNYPLHLFIVLLIFLFSANIILTLLYGYILGKLR
jgi:hypothetical protein